MHRRHSPAKPATPRRAAELLAPAKGAIAAILALAMALAVVNAAGPLALRRLFDGIGHGDGGAAA